jgi:Mg/Co/Ni transporter MgtE
MHLGVQMMVAMMVAMLVAMMVASWGPMLGSTKDFNGCQQQSMHLLHLLLI